MVLTGRGRHLGDRWVLLLNKPKLPVGAAGLKPSLTGVRQKSLPKAENFLDLEEMRRKCRPEADEI